MRNTLSDAARAASSHRVTIWLLGAVAVVVVLGLSTGIDIATWIALPLAGLMINLLAALAAHAALRTQPMLYAFHVMLAVLLALITADRLTALKGHVEVTEGAAFDPRLATIEAGPLHPYGLDDVSFVQGTFEINYLPGMKRRETVSFASVPDARGGWTQVSIGDDYPLVDGHYRFYTSFNKGFAPVVTYTYPSGRSLTGAVHMPSYPLRDFDQGNEWAPPGRDPIKLWLRIEQPVYDPELEWHFRKPDDPVLVVIEDGARHELTPGQDIDLGEGGRIRFEALQVWMGYTIVANLFNTWMIVTAIAACLALAAHFLGKILPAGFLRAAPQRGES